jgi:hypothetical protein
MFASTSPNRSCIACSHGTARDSSLEVMAHGGTDLNLLLPLSEPAMSAAPARLPRRYDDELVVRAHAVRLTQRGLGLEDEFDPANALLTAATWTSRTSTRSGTP